MRLTKYEQETIIIYNKGEDTAEVSTYEKRLQRHIEEKLGIQPSSHMDCGGRVYKMPKSYIKLPRAPKKLSAETKIRLKKHARQINKHRRFGDNL